MSFVYFIRAGIFTKIGVANNVERRLSQIQNGNPILLKLESVIKMPSREAAFDLESYLHKYYDKHRKEGEWFFIKTVKLKQAFIDYENERCVILNPQQKLRIRTTKDKVDLFKAQRNELIKLLKINNIEVPKKLLSNRVLINDIN